MTTIIADTQPKMELDSFVNFFPTKIFIDNFAASVGKIVKLARRITKTANEIACFQ